MNIAILIPTLGGGGAERVASSIGDYLYNKGNNVFYFLGNNKVKNKYSVKGTVVKTEINISHDNDMQCLISLVKAAYSIRNYKKLYKIDVAVSFMEEFNYINILSKGKEKVIIRICTIISQRNDLQKSILYNKSLLKMVYSKADTIIVMTKYAKKELITTYGLPYKRIVVIPNPVSNLQHNNVKEQWKYGNNTIICIGRLEDVKQYNVAIRAFQYLQKQLPSTQMIVLGEGKNKEKIRRMVVKCGLNNNVHLLGFKVNVADYLENSKVCIVTSKVEGFNISMLEAMSKGVPVVSINCPGGPSEILGGNCMINNMVQRCSYGILTPYINNDSWNTEFVNKEEKVLANEVRSLLENHELYSAYSRKALERAKRYEFCKIASMWERVLLKI